MKDLTEYEEYKTRDNRRHKHFMKTIESIFKSYKDDIKNSKNEEDFKFYLWNALGEAYEKGRGNLYEELYDLTNAEDVFREKIRNEI